MATLGSISGLLPRKGRTSYENRKEAVGENPTAFFLSRGRQFYVFVVLRTKTGQIELEEPVKARIHERYSRITDAMEAQAGRTRHHPNQ